jgi:FtsP/CotA-like multicopper oxidase with cupredoxin domain
MEEPNVLDQDNGGQEETFAGDSNAIPAQAASHDTRRGFMRSVLGVAAGMAFGGLAHTPEAQAQLGSPNLVMPPEIRSREADKTLRGVMELFSGKFDIPNVGNGKPLRQFRGWDASAPAPPVRTAVGPGPTLRARIGDKVKLAVHNRIDDSMFAYTFDTNSKPGFSSFGCDASNPQPPNPQLYPVNDKFPNCFHGSSTANIHFHGTHTSPDGLGDNVLVQILPDTKQPDWSKDFNEVFNMAAPPPMWHNMPGDYQTRQRNLITEHDKQAAAAAQRNTLPAPDPLEPKNKELIDAHQWPEYIMGAFPNYFELPDYASGKYKAGQAPGTHWYHAHKHGSTSIHMLNGLAGVFVIESNAEGGYDHAIRRFYNWGNSYGDHEKILVFQQIDPDLNLERQVRTARTGSQQVFINGLLTPTITMKPGEVQLWRFVNATVGSVGGAGVGNGVICPDVFTGAAAAGFKMMQTAADGVQFSPDNYRNQPFLNNKVPTGLQAAPTTGLILYAGNRADLLVQAPLNPTTTPVAFTSNNNTRFFVNVAGAAVTQGQGFPSDWPEMPPFLHDLRAPGPNDITDPNSPVKFQWNPGDGPGRNKTTNAPPHFMINNKQFGETGDIVDQCMPLDGLQDWVLENYTTIPHPFHIHINPFQIVRIDVPVAAGGSYNSYTPANNRVWQDTVAIPAGVLVNNVWTPGKVTIRQTYLDFIGTYVLHCHILAHEDRGMMQLVRVVPANLYPKACQGGIPAHH